MKQFIITISLLLGFIYSHAQDKKQLSDFDFIINKIKNDYPGYSDKVNDENIQELKKLEKKTRKMMIQYPDSCYKYLKDYTAWFKDYHLRVSKIRNSSKRESYKKKYAEFNLDSLQKTSKAIEGIWIGYRGSFAVKKELHKYIAISIDLRGYEKNQIIFEAIEKKNNEFDLTTYRNNRGFKPRQEKASLLLNNSVLEIHNDTRFVRKTANKKADMAFLLSYIPIHPNGLNTYSVALSLNDSTFYLRVPGFSTNTANDLVEKHWNEITTRPNLIVDIRNNGGGQDNYYRKLAELIYTNPYESKGVEWYSTKGIIEDWEDAIKKGHIKKGGEEWANVLLKKMKEKVGGFVIHPFHEGDTKIERDTVYSYPKNVGIIINSGNASSAEQFLLTAKNSSKVILFGNENTAGVLDYSNITPKELPSGKYKLWLPATRSRRLPDHPIDNIGIAPDIHIPLEPTLQLFDRLDDWVYFVKNYLEYKE
ncbi:S41 family peptidase [Marinifilum flexuosum]|uniref:S41 family peptidase n=1 Tax=Marinifilum flexuosum TaxID=1117708 RepID=UPI002493F740|nr:S41 family peptidase [Marinifilum flexuosum]